MVGSVKSIGSSEVHRGIEAASQRGFHQIQSRRLKRKKARRLRTGPAFFRPQPPRVETTTKLEPEYDACVVAEVALVVIAARKGVAEPSQHEIKLCRPECDGFAQRDVDSSTNDEIKCIVARSRAA